MTEPEYIKGFERWKRDSTCDVRCVGGSGDPKRIVEKARDLVKEAGRLARADHDESAVYDETWCVFDRDQHTRYDEAVSMANGLDFKLAVSNPCFELWLLLHHRESPGCRERGDIQKMLKKMIGGGAKHLQFDQDYKTGYEQAHQRARQLDDRADSDGAPPERLSQHGVLPADEIDRRAVAGLVCHEEARGRLPAERRPGAGRIGYARPPF